MILFIVGYLLIGLALNGLINNIPIVREQRAKVKEQFKDNLLGYNIGVFFGFFMSTLLWPVLLLVVVVGFFVGFIGAALGFIK